MQDLVHRKLPKFGFIFFAAGILLLSDCSKNFRMNHWKIQPDAKSSSLSIQQEKLGNVLTDVKLAVKRSGKAIALKGWKINRGKSALTIQTSAPEQTTWRFTTGDSTLLVACSDKDAILQGTAPASDARFPARVASQDNNVMITSLGLISAQNLNHLFDRQTEIMIEFPEGSLLSRNTLSPDTLTVEIPVEANQPAIRLIPKYYTDKVGIAHYQKTKFKPVYRPAPNRFKRAPTGWSSWYCYYMNANEKDMVKETDVLSSQLKPYGLEYVQLDACFTRGEDANWLEWTKSSFPHGGKWLFQYITGKGLKPALWVNLYGANYAKPAMADKYPDNFFLRDKNGKLSGACCTADTTVVRLDYTNPAVIEKHLKPLMTTLVDDWGLRYLKDAGWGTWMDYYEKNRANAYDSTRDSREVYRQVQKVVRDIMGPNNYILGCAMHEVGVGFGYYDGSRVGGDDKAIWAPPKGKKGISMQTFFNSLFGANYLNGITWWSDPDAVMVRSPLTYEEAKTIVTTIALSGQAYMASDFMAQLPSERMALYKKTMPTLPIHAVDLYPFRTKPVCCPKPANFPKALDLKVNAATGSYDVVGLYNWDDHPALKSLNFSSDLGLDSTKNTLVFNFWDQTLAGVFSDSIQTDIPAHGVKALIIRPLVNHPTILATSRHISSAVSILKMAWNDSTHTLNGVSKTITGTPYAIFVYVPGEMRLDTIESPAKVLYHTRNGNLLKVAFQGQESPIRWALEFK